MYKNSIENFTAHTMTDAQYDRAIAAMTLEQREDYRESGGRFDRSAQMKEDVEFLDSVARYYRTSGNEAEAAKYVVLANKIREVL